MPKSTTAAKDEHGYTPDNYQPLPNKEAIVHFNGKTLLTSESYLDVKAYEHALAFTVAGLMDEDLLKEVRDAVAAALENGTDFAEFKRRLKPYLMAKGWLAETLDDGTQQLVVGSNRRLSTIYSTNLQTAYSAGQWQRIQQTKEFLPYLQYMPSVSEHPRLSHKRYYGLCRPANDPIWQSIMPPNGYGCKCWVKQLTKRQAEKVGISDAVPIETEEFTNPRTGETSQVAIGIEPSFNHNFDRLTALLKLAEDRHGKLFANDLKHETEKLLSSAQSKAAKSPAPKQTPLPPPQEWQAVAQMGKALWQKHHDLFDAVDYNADHSFAQALMTLLEREGVELGGTVRATGDNVKKVTEILKRYPASWIHEANEMGMTFVRDAQSRGFHLFLDRPAIDWLKRFAHRSAHYKIFAKFMDEANVGDSLLKVNNMRGKAISRQAYDITIHEMAHRLQSAIPELDAYFRQLWIDRTRDEVTRPLATIQSERGEIPYYAVQEVGRRDKFANVYIGRDYGTNGQVAPKEVMTMTFQTLLASNTDQLSVKILLERDPEMLYLGIALLARYVP